MQKLQLFNRFAAITLGFASSMFAADRWTGQTVGSTIVNPNYLSARITGQSNFCGVYVSGPADFTKQALSILLTAQSTGAKVTLYTTGGQPFSVSTGYSGDICWSVNLTGIELEKN